MGSGEHGQDIVLGWEFKTRTKELYQLVSSKFNVDSYSDFKMEDDMKGFKLARLLNQARDPIRLDIGVH